MKLEYQIKIGEVSAILNLLHLFQFLCICILLLSLVSIFGAHSKICELASHFRLQYLIGSIVCLIFFLALNSWTFVLVAFVSFGLNAFEIFSIYSKRAHELKNTTHTLRIVFANVLYQNRTFAPFIKLIEKEQPDIFIVQEVTDRWLDALQPLCGCYPYVISNASNDGGGGIAIFSKFPFLHSEVISLGYEERQSVLATLKLGEKVVSIYTFHPQAPIRRFHFGYRNHQLATAAELTKKLNSPKIVIGDLNTTHWSPFFKKLIKETELTNARQSFGLLPTWPLWKLPLKFLMIPIDHCLVSSDVRIRQIKTGPFINSDHLPLIVDLDV